MTVADDGDVLDDHWGERLVACVSLDVREAYLHLLDSRARVAVANQALAQAREAFPAALASDTHVTASNSVGLNCGASFS